MLHPSYTELMEKINSKENRGEIPAINSRYSIVIATAKRARELIAGKDPIEDVAEKEKPLSVAVSELYNGEIHILSEDDPRFDDSLDYVGETGDDGEDEEEAF